MLAVADLLAAAIAAGVVAVCDRQPLAFAFLPLWLLVAKLLGLYDRDHRALRHLTADEVPAIIAWAATITAAARAAAAADLCRGAGPVAGGGLRHASPGSRR